MAEIPPGTEVQEQLKESHPYSVIIKSQMNCFSYFQSLLGLEFLNSNKCGDMADILKSFHDQYVPLKMEKCFTKLSCMVISLLKKEPETFSGHTKMGRLQQSALKAWNQPFESFT